MIDSDGSRHVAIWQGPGPAGPWTQAPTSPVQGRDGPNETIFSITGSPSGMAAFGYRNSPTEGYPRPSTWYSPAPEYSSWREILEDREFFGGPDVIGFAGLVYGPHGFTLPGTWTDSHGRASLAVWRSPDGVTWTRDTTEAAFQGRKDQIPAATGVADSSAGMLLAGTVGTPAPASPTRQEGGLWYSAAGKSWTRLALSPRSEPPDSSTTFNAVVTVPGGWVVLGTEQTANGTRAVAWIVDRRLAVSAPTMLPTSGGKGAKPLTAVIDGDQIVVVGADADRPKIWTSRLSAAGRAAWKAVKGPANTDFSIDDASVAVGQAGLLVVVSGSDRSAEWWTTHIPG